MIDYIKGQIAELTPTYAVVDNHGVGYMLNISLSTFDRLGKLKPDEEPLLYVHEAIREDAHVLYGFVDKRERELFLLLISVSGVGPGTARMILSTISPSDLESCIASDNVAALKSVKGVGAKTAQRIIVDLRDKIKAPSVTLLNKSETGSAVFEEALSALVALGFTQPVSQKALKKLFGVNPAITVEQAIKQALKMM